MNLGNGYLLFNMTKFLDDGVFRPISMIPDGIGLCSVKSPHLQDQSQVLPTLNPDAQLRLVGRAPPPGVRPRHRMEAGRPSCSRPGTGEVACCELLLVGL